MEIKVGSVYRAKKPGKAGGNMFGSFYNDRAVLYMDEQIVQYDSPAIPFGGRYKKMSRVDFEKWAGSDVTDVLPVGEWAPYGK